MCDRILMVLGDNHESGVIVEKANELGVKTIVVGINKNTKPKQIAYKSFDVNALDVDALEFIAKKEHVSGVIVGVADVLVSSYTELCKRLNLPCYANMEAVKYLANKSLFKKQLEAVGLPVIPEYQDVSEYVDVNYENLPLPVVVKPVDSGGGVGISIVLNKSQLQPAISKALENSHSRRIQIEKYMAGDIVACYYTIIDGKVYLSSLEDNIFTKKQGLLCPVTTGHFYGSKYIPLYFDTVHDKICKLLENIHVKNGILQINAFIENDLFYFYDPGYRFQGEAQHHILNAVNKFDHKKMMIDFAFSGKMYDGDFNSVNDPWLHGKKCASIWILLKCGMIKKIIGLDDIVSDKRIIFNGQRLFENMEVTDKMIGTEKQVLTRLYAVCNDVSSLNSIIDMIRESVFVVDSNDTSMILDSLCMYMV